jgi:hypothetical protein
VWGWQERFAAQSIDGSLRDKTGQRGSQPCRRQGLNVVVARTLDDPPDEATHLTAAGMPRDAGITISSVQRIWRAHGLKPHRTRTFKLSRDPAFAAKLRDIVRLHVDPPAHAVVLSVDEKSQIQALDRTRPSLLLKTCC